TTAPCITITKTCDPTVSIGQPINFHVELSNCGTPVTGVTVVDSIAGTIIGPIDLAPGQTVTFDSQFPNNGCGPLIGTVTATENDACPGSPLSSPTPRTSDLTTAPCIAITKTCDPTVPIGQPINYQVRVSNCSLNTP